MASRGWQIVAWTVLIGAVACGEADSYAPVEQIASDAVLAAVTDDVGRQVGDNGDLPGVAPSELLRFGELSLERASEVARAWAETYAPWHEHRLESQRGSQINLAALQPCGEPLLAASRFEPLPPEVPLAFHIAYGSWWLFALCDDKGPAVSLAVSAAASHLRVVQGRINLVPGSGSEFFSAGLPEDWAGPIPLSAASAAVTAAARSHQKIAALPTLVAADPRHGAPQLAMWMLKLDSPCRDCREGAVGSSRDELVLVAPPAILFGRHKQSGVRTYLVAEQQHQHDVRMRGSRADASDQTVRVVRLRPRTGFAIDLVEFGGAK